MQPVPPSFPAAVAGRGDWKGREAEAEEEEGGQVEGRRGLWEGGHGQRAHSCDALRGWCDAITDRHDTRPAQPPSQSVSQRTVVSQRLQG